MIECIVIILYENTHFQISRLIKELNFIKKNKNFRLDMFLYNCLLMRGLNINWKFIQLQF
jgi:hypothetical protein